MNTIPTISLPYAPGSQFHAFTVREPVGWLGKLFPELPFVNGGLKLGPALTAGNCVVLKPAEQTPPSALRLGELLLEVGFPEGVVNIVTGLAQKPRSRARCSSAGGQNCVYRFDGGRQADCARCRQ